MYDFVSTYTNKEMNLLNPKAEDVDIYDIAYTLSHINRWNGTVLFTVAQHSLLVAKIVRLNGGMREDILLALLHDSAEAYIGDMPKPIKDMCTNSQFLISEQLIEQAIRQAFGLGGFDTMLPQGIKEADELACKLEAYYLNKGTKNFDTSNIPTVDKSLVGMIKAENADIVESEFIKEFNSLMYGIVTEGILIWERGEVIGELFPYSDSAYCIKENKYVKTLIDIVPKDLSNIVSLKKLINDNK